MSSFLPESDPSFPAMSRRSSSPIENSFSSSSFSLSSSSLQYLYQSDEFSPVLSRATSLKFSGIPFSWEKLPGIPKKQTPNKNKDLPPLNVLPLPPPTNSKRFIELTTRKKNTSSSDKNITNDPFLAAFVECCKDDEDDDQETTTCNQWEVTKASRNPSDYWYGFVNFYTSCKRTCAVSESIVYIPRSSKTSNDIWNRRFA